LRVVPVGCARERGPQSQIRRAYRNLSLEFHPDKNPGDKVAAERFRRVARANEVLTNDEERKKLDYYMENPAEYWELYGPYISYAYAPKTSVATVLLLLLLFVSAMQPAIQMSKHSQYVDKLKKAALNKWPVGGGGTPESLEIRKLAEQKLSADAGKKKVTKLDRKKLEEAVDAIIRDLEIEGEFRKPSWREVPIVRVCMLPVRYGRAASRYLSIEYKRYKGIDLDEEEQQEVIERFLGGADAWEALSDQEQDTLIAQACWRRDNFDAWLAARNHSQAALPDQTQAKPPAKDTPPLSAKGKQQLRQRRKTKDAKFVVSDD